MALPSAFYTILAMVCTTLCLTWEARSICSAVPHLLNVLCSHQKTAWVDCSTSDVSPQGRAGLRKQCVSAEQLCYSADTRVQELRSQAICKGVLKNGVGANGEYGKHYLHPALSVETDPW